MMSVIDSRSVKTLYTVYVVQSLAFMAVLALTA
jgi:hypothetical protein